MMQNEATKQGTSRMDAQEDLRVRRTRKLLCEAFLELTVEKGYTAVTVSDIAERAMVNRSTFYRHYLDKSDLLEQYVDEVYQMTTAFDAEDMLPPGGKSPQDVAQEIPKGLMAFLNHILEFKEFYRVMLGPQGDQCFTQQLRTMIEKRYRFLLGHVAQSDPNVPPFDLHITYIACANIGAITWWLDHQEECTAEQLGIWLKQLSYINAGHFYLQNQDARKPPSTTQKAQQNGSRSGRAA